MSLELLEAEPTIEQPCGERTRAEKRGWPRWLRIGAGEILLAVLVLGVVQRSQSGMLDDPGLGWHLRNIDAMVDVGGWLQVDPFAGPRAGQPWLTNQWLGDLTLRTGEAWAGLNGIAAVTTLVIGLTMYLLYRMLAADGLPWPVAAGWTFAAAMGTSLSWVARPNVFTLPLVLITVRICDLWHQGRISRRQTLWLWPLMALWANTHGGFIAGLIILGVTLAVEAAITVFGMPQDRAAAASRAKHVALLFAGAVTATLINPYGWRLYPWTLSLLGDSYFMNLNSEWHSPDFHAVGAMRYELLILLVPLLIGLARGRQSLVALGLCLAWLHFALGGERYVSLWVLVAAPLLARASVQVPELRALVARVPISSELRSALSRPALPSSWIGALIIAVALFGWARTSSEFARHGQSNLPTTVLDRLITEHHGEVVLHDYNWGGYLTWHAWPQLKTWIDDRNEVQGRQHVQAYFALLETTPGWQAELDRQQVGLVCIRTNTPLAYRLAESADWTEIERSDYAVLFRRKAG